MLILDSNTISYYFRGDPQVVPRLQALRPAEVAVRPAVVRQPAAAGAAGHSAIHIRRWPARPPRPGAAPASAAPPAGRRENNRRWVADVIRKYAAQEWSPAVKALAGQFADFPVIDNDGAATLPHDVARIEF